MSVLNPGCIIVSQVERKSIIFLPNIWLTKLLGYNGAQSGKNCGQENLT